MLRGPFRIVALLCLVGLFGAAIVTALAPDSASVVELRIPDPIERDLDQIIERDTIVALTSYNPTSYFVYRGEAFGYEFELLKDFAEQADVVVTMRVVPRDSLLYFLNVGMGDVVAARLFPTDRDTSQFTYTQPLYETPPSVVQATGPLEVPDPALDTLLAPEASDRQIRNQQASGDAAGRGSIRIRGNRIQTPGDLAGEQVFLPEDHAYIDRLVEIENRVTGDIEVVEVDTLSEALIRQVARGGIDLTVAPQNVAQLEASYFENLEVNPVIGPATGVVWAVRRNAPNLADTLNRWILENRDSNRWAGLYRKYYVDRDGFRERVESRYLTSETSVLSEFDDVFKANAEEIGWDWRLLASQAFQESRFKPRARSWAGAMGLLQIMPLTAQDLGITDAYDIEQNVNGAVRYLRWLDETYWAETIPDSLERQKFILASYNAGAGHVMDAQRLTEKYGGDKTQWADVAYWMLKKSDPAYYNDPVVRHGYARGLEPVHYVAIILERFDHYRQFVTDEADAAA